MEDVEKREELEAMEKRVRIEVEGKQVKQTLEQILNAAKFKLQKDFKITKRLNALALISPREVLDDAESLELQKLSDVLIAEHGFDL